MIDVVVIVRMHTGEDIIAIITGELDDKVRIEHPYYIRVNSTQGSVAMVPYCALSDEKFFQIDRSKIEFVALANNDISDRFLKMVDGIERIRLEEILDEDDEIDHLEAKLMQKTFIEGNDTKH